MNISVLNNSVSVSVDIDTEAAVNAIATNAAMVTYKVVKFTLNRAVEDSRKVIGEVSKVTSVFTDKAKRDIDTVVTAGRSSGLIVEDTLNISYDNAKATVIRAIADAQVTRDSVITATKVKVAKAIDTRVVKPSEEIAAKVSAPVKEKVASLEKAFADYTRIEEVEAIAQEVASSSANAVQDTETSAIAQETPQVIGDALVSSAGVTSLNTVTEEQPQAIAVTEAVEEGHPKASGLSALIREEVAKH